ncbi:MAG: rod shape-determining protein RodA [Pseudomonadota bacterium]
MFHLDLPLLLALLALCALGLVVLYSASGQSDYLLIRQAVRLGLAFFAMLVIAQIPPNYLRIWSPWAFLGGTGLLVAVLFLGDEGGGAQRWLDLGFMRFQPSEIMKLAVPMAVAWLLHSRPLPPSLMIMFLALAMVMVPAALIALQPDLGTALLIAVSGLIVLFLGGLSWRLIMAGGLTAAAAAPALWFVYLHDYQKERVLTFLNPESDPLGSGYHIIQSKIAIGSGGLFGKGWTNGSQASLDFLPEPYTDFIFAVLSEEFGLMGVLTVLTAYALVIGRGLMIAVQAQDTYSRLLSGSLSFTFFVYLIVNTGMVSGLLPVVGVPMPLVSYGGTSMVTIMAGFGILMSVQTHRRLLSR